MRCLQSEVKIIEDKISNLKFEANVKNLACIYVKFCHRPGLHSLKQLKISYNIQI